MGVSLEDVKKLKEITGLGLGDAKKALVEADGDFDKALEALRKKGLTKAEKKGDRETREGIIDSYVHSDRIGVVVEVNCETDFVARLPEFREFAHQMAMQVAAMAPVYPTMEDVPSDIYEAKKAELLASDDLAKKPEEIREKIVEGQLSKYFADQVLTEQVFILDDSITVGERIKQQVAKNGENIRVSQFRRIELGVTE
ncbi:translation elongation factor Ts [Candidatus Mycosynbacter amalyticus]|uniref:Elongation factor Ts n=1 Tax=Candidatus Mycosynbacter amalyticus TaxID=2665156 RepID=A0A857MJ04_9BACT|nr:translation elongation factor Ts [Candidatus Mycosynbacter amalyticus]QHN42523.1 translation elongation factor Ts [Candidatus Mycosynbacter amalyticus]